MFESAPSLFGAALRVEQRCAFRSRASRSRDEARIEESIEKRTSSAIIVFFFSLPLKKKNEKGAGLRVSNFRREKKKKRGKKNLSIRLSTIARTFA